MINPPSAALLGVNARRQTAALVNGHQSLKLTMLSGISEANVSGHAGCPH